MEWLRLATHWRVFAGHFFFCSGVARLPSMVPTLVG